VAKSFSSTGVTTGTYADRLALSSPFVGMQFYQTDTDETLRYATDVDGANRWISVNAKNNRNVVINGAFNIAQRCNAFTSGSVGSTPVTSGYWTYDRWQTLRQGAVAGATYSRVAGPSGFANALRMQRDSGNTSAVTIELRNSTESINVYPLQGKYVTLSFFARAGANYSPTSSLFSVYLQTGTGTDSNTLGGFTGSLTPIAATVTLTTSWQRFVLVTPAVLASSVTQLGLVMLSTPVGTAGANDYADVTGIQVESGTAPSDFEFIPFGIELATCQRYYETSYTYGTYLINSSGAAVSASLEGSGYHTIIAAAGSTPVSIGYRVLKRIAPVITYYSYNSVAGRYSYRDNAADNVGAITVARISASGFGVILNSGNNFSAGGTLWIGFIANAELS